MARMRLRTIAELILGSVQMYAQFIGSTTFNGAVTYETLTLGWWIWMVTGKMWGFLPLNIAGAVVSTWNLWSVLK